MIINKNRLIFIAFFASFFAANMIGAHLVSAAGPNLIQNPNLEIATVPGTPDGWLHGSWGTNKVTFTYPVTGVTGNAVKTAFTSYTSGDAKWFFKDVPVTAGTKYLFSDSYNSNVPSYLVIQYTSKTNTLSYVALATLASSNNAWANASTTFTAPSNASSVTMFHLIQKVGTLSTDNYFLGTFSTPTSTPTSTPPAALTITPLTLSNGQVGASYSQLLTASTTATGTFTWSISAGTLPAGLALNSAGGTTATLAGTPTTAATSTFSIRATNGSSSSTQPYTISIAPVIATSTPPVISITATSPLTAGTVGTVYAQTITATSTNATDTLTWSLASGALPTGLSLATTTGQLAGTPSVATTTNFTIAVKGSNPASTPSSKSFALTINPAIATSTPTSTLVVNLSIASGTATFSDFNLKIMNGTSTTFNGPAANTQSFIMNVGSSYSITEATSTNSKDYTVALAPSCTGVIGTSTATCTITNTFVPPVINFILNPSMETAGTVAGFPDKWTHGGWGTNNAVFTYPAAGVNGGVGANITFTSYTDGDAKWYFNDVAVASNTSYTFSDSYNANVPTILMAQFTSKTGVISYAQVSSLPATNGAWSTASTTISTPADVATVTIFHMLTSVGSLTTDNYSLAPTVYDPATLFSTGLVSLTFDDGWQSQYDNAFPILQAANLKGSFYIISDGMLNSQEVIFPNAGNPLNVVATPTSATWPQIYTDPSLHAFNFSNTYTATGPSTITVSYTLPGGAASSSVVGTLPAGTNATGTISFVLPAINGPITISQVVANTDTLTTSNPLLTESVGYLDTNHVLAMQAAGHEIGNHTVNHCDLVALENNANNVASCAYVPPPSTTPQQQIVNARNALLSAGLTPIDTLAYPYGSGAGDTNIENIVKTNGMIAARGVATGYNTKLTDHFALLDQNIMSNTDPVTIHGWIDYAIANKVWLIITYHQVETSASTLAQNGEVDGTTSAVFQDTVNYLSAQQAAGKVHVDTTHNIMTQFMN